VYQACRGTKYDHGVLIEDQVDAPGSEIDVPTVRRIPVEADVLIAYSVVPGIQCIIIKLKLNVVLKLAL